MKKNINLEHGFSSASKEEIESYLKLYNFLRASLQRELFIISVILLTTGLILLLVNFPETFSMFLSGLSLGLGYFFFLVSSKSERGEKWLKSQIKRESKLKAKYKT